MTTTNNPINLKILPKSEFSIFKTARNKRTLSLLMPSSDPPITINAEQQ